MKTGWWSFELPYYRPHIQKGKTYSLFPYEDLPPVVENPDADFEWLKSQPVKEHSLFNGSYPDGSQPDLGKLAGIVSRSGLHLPAPFITFINSPELHRRIRSCTDCYLDTSDYAVETRGSIRGYLVHFLSDSQWVGHWYLHIDRDGRHFIAASLNAYGFDMVDDDEHPAVKTIDLQEEEIWLCAPSFTEFLYRFWLENEIWFALARDKRALTPEEQAYVNGYLSGAK